MNDRRAARYAAEEIAAAKALRAQGLQWKAVATKLGGAAEDWRDAVRRAEMKRIGKARTYSHTYAQGKNARKADKPKSECPYPRMSQHGSWWLAGWNDEDRGDV
ncbi:hypothetical protein GOD54_23580 [Sinorhizobium medicae]|nr:hypothetical protein [Sinorhizobium medicae]